MKYISPFLFCYFLFGFSLHAQMPDHVPGELIIHLESGVSPSEFCAHPLELNGSPVSLTLKKTLSARMNIHLVKFTSDIHENIVLRGLRMNPSVKVAQFNHYMTSRVIPNDPDFGQQWDKHNTGQNGGTANADIDAPEAWDIATGGLTALGDTIVIAIIDGGFDLAHEDIWFFKNYNEIPNNSIDDDNNGYVDDFDGWNAYNGNGDPNDPGGDHGTHVSGIAAAKGNNNTGIAGVNWGAQVLPVAGSAGDEATVVAAYSYVMEVRRLYNNTNGTKGAFVVSTNSSFGVDYGLPSNFPIWCAMYDSLGSVGILSAGATANINLDVDVDSDIPTACSSPHMVAVTNTDSDDNLNNSAGYGATTIDLGSPGTDVYSCLPADDYGSLTGTSMATPQVAGAIALMYSAACSSLVVDYKASPGPYALVFRDFMLNGVDTIPALTGITVTNGRLNLHKMLLNVLNFCSGGSGCYTPFGLGVSNLSDTTATLGWANISAADSFLVQWRPVGSSNWDSVFNAGNSLNIDSLSGCTPYEFQVQSWCPSDTGAWSNIFTFTSEGCCDPPAGLSSSNFTPASADLSWNTVFAANSYNVRYREVGTPAWTGVPAASNSLSISGLDSCVNYEFQVETVCDTGLSGFSLSAFFSTTGCGICAEGNYCASVMDGFLEWIDGISIGSINNNSGTDNGYGNYTHLSTVLYRGQPHSIELVPGFDFAFGGYFWMVWVDLNQDEDFEDAGENVLNTGSTNATVNTTFTVPGSALLGRTRMRVINQWFGEPGQCENGGFGETEDYCVDIQDGTGSAHPIDGTSVEVFPNPFTNEITLWSIEPIESVEIYSVAGMKVFGQGKLAPGKNLINPPALPEGIYLLKVYGQNGMTVRRISKM